MLSKKCQKEEKEFVAAEEERKFLEMNLLGTSSAKPLLYTAYYYNGKIFGLRGGDHTNIVVNIFELGYNFIKFNFKKNLVKHFREESLISNIFPEQLSISVTKKA